MKDIAYAIPFSNERMMVTTVIRINESTLRVFTKGAAEYTLRSCFYYYDENGKIRTFQERQRRRLVHDIVIEKIAKSGDKPLALCYRDIPEDKFQKIKEKNNGLITEEDLMKAFETHMVLLALVGVKDDLRDDIKEVV